MASEPYADPVADHGNSQQSSDGENITLHRISDTGRNGDKDGVKSATPTAVLTGTPMTTSSGMTRIGPPAPDSAQTAAVIRPKRIQTGRGICLFFVCARLSAETSVSGVSFVLPQKDGETGE